MEKWQSAMDDEVLKGLQKATHADSVSTDRVVLEVTYADVQTLLAPAPSGFGIYGEYAPITVGAGAVVKTPAPSDGLREENERTMAVLKSACEDNQALKDAGNAMAAAAFRVATEYDGCHRLMLAVSDWSLAVANEGGRGTRYEPTALTPAPAQEDSKHDG